MKKINLMAFMVPIAGSTLFIFISLFFLASSTAYPQQIGENSISFAGVFYSSANWGDFDNDGDLDVVITGRDSTFKQVSKLYKNNGNDTFTELTSAFLTGLENGSVAWGDYDNDGFLDLLLTGSTSDVSSYATKLYRNNGDETFSEQTSIIFPGDLHSAVWEDYDNDGYMDILFYGFSGTKIFKNNGDGTFSEQTSVKLPGLIYSAAWGDYDNDGDPDILLSGSNGTVIYKNNGNGIFSEQKSISLETVSGGSVAWGDYDNDGFLDILLSGSTTYSRTAKIYRNNGNDTFTELTSVSLTGLGNGSVAWGDYDNDGLLDILLSGQDANAIPLTIIYRNNGNGTFTAQTGFSLTDVEYGSAIWGDYDNDGDLDVLLNGLDGNNKPVCKIYDNYSSIPNTVPIKPTNLTSIVDGNKVTLSWDKSTDKETPQNGLNYNLVIGKDPNGVDPLSPLADRSTGFRRVIRLGNSQANSSVSYFLPEGTYYWSVQAIDGTFAGSEFALEKTFEVKESIRIIFPNGGENWVAGTRHNITWKYSNVENVKIEYTSDDGTNWSIITPSTPAVSGSYTWAVPSTPSGKCKVRITDSSNQNSYDISDNTFTITGPVPEQMPITLAGVYRSNVSWGDYDNDGFLDILLMGKNVNDKDISKIYRNNGNGTFSEQTSISLTNVSGGSAAWGDYNNDGYLDILLTGSTGNVITSKIYRNNGNGRFTDQTSISLEKAVRSSASWGDYDNDGYLDILLSGYNGSTYFTKIYRNDGKGNFSEQYSFQSGGDAAIWGDYNNDGYLDFLLADYDKSKIFKNNGNGTFTEQNSISLTGVSMGLTAWGDYNNDGYLDVLLTGYDGKLGYIMKIFKNNGGETFTEKTSVSLANQPVSSASWGDYDNDGFLDILLLSGNDGYSAKTRIFRNNGNDTFTPLTSTQLKGVYDGSAALGDYDNDGDIDILLTGISANDGYVSLIYRNDSTNPNTTPVPPTNLNTIVNGNKVTFSWDKSTDGQTPQDGLSYNLRIGSASNQENTLSAMSDNLNGFRKVVRAGNSQKNGFEVTNLPVGKYYWSVQAIDGSFAGSAFAPENTFEIQTTQVEETKLDLVKEYYLLQNYPNPFNPVSLIKYGLPSESLVRLKIYNSLGQEVKELVNSVQSQGPQEIRFNAGSFSTGVYYYLLEAISTAGQKNYREVKKMLLLK